MISIVCTGRGTHDSEWLAEVEETDPMHPRRRGRPLSWLEAQETSSTTWRDGFDPYYLETYHFRCPDNVCRRHKQIRRENWQLLIETYIAQGLTSLDVSRLPF